MNLVNIGNDFDDIVKFCSFAVTFAYKIFVM